VEYCRKLLEENVYEEFSLEFGLTVLKEFIKKNYKSGDNNYKKIADIIQIMLMSRVKLEDQNSLMNLFQSFNL
jgi:hypothetical protein